MIAAVKAPGPLAQDALVHIPARTPTSVIAAKMAEIGVIDDRNVFIVAAKLYNLQAPLQAGEYNIPAQARIDDVLSLMQSGKTWQRKFTVAEGLTSVEIAAALKTQEGLTGDIGFTPPDGSLLPETYAFSFGDTREGIIARMQKSMGAEIKRLWDARPENFALKSQEEAVTLASIVEKETGIASERARVAGVFYNRLKAGIPLQSDPTVIYALTMGETPMNRALTYNDLKTPSPYNTYVTPGLPPSAIANPGRASLEAVFSPETHEYIYFVADGTGGHVFAKTLKEHNDNVAKWRRIRAGK